MALVRNIYSAVTRHKPAAKKQMALHEKLKALAAKAKKLPADIEANADALAARIDAVDTRAVNSFGALAGVMEDADAAIAATEDAVNQLSNGAPK